MSASTAKCHYRSNRCMQCLLYATDSSVVGVLGDYCGLYDCVLSPIAIDFTVPWSVCLSLSRSCIMLIAETAEDIDRISFAYDSPCLCPTFGLHRSAPSSQILSHQTLLI